MFAILMYNNFKKQSLEDLVYDICIMIAKTWIVFLANSYKILSYNTFTISKHCTI